MFPHSKDWMNNDKAKKVYDNKGVKDTRMWKNGRINTALTFCNVVRCSFGVGDITVSHNHSLLGYSLDLNGSEYYTIYIRRIADEKIVTKEIQNTSGGITFSKDTKYIFYNLVNHCTSGSEG